MPIIDYLERNAREFGDDVALVEINPDVTETRRVTWREYELIEANPTCQYRREITWNVFNEKANRFANLLVERGIKKGEKVYEQRENEKSSCTYADLHFCNKCNRMRWSNEV